MKCSRVKCSNYAKGDYKPCAICKKEDERFLKESWKGFDRVLNKAFTEIQRKDIKK